MQKVTAPPIEWNVKIHITAKPKFKNRTRRFSGLVGPAFRLGLRWRFGIVLTALRTLTKLHYVEPSWCEMDDRSFVGMPFWYETSHLGQLSLYPQRSGKWVPGNTQLQCSLVRKARRRTFHRPWYTLLRVQWPNNGRWAPCRHSCKAHGILHCFQIRQLRVRAAWCILPAPTIVHCHDFWVICYKLAVS